MSRAPFQVLVLPFRKLADGTVEFAVFQRADDQNWQAIAGGGQRGESAFIAASREALEEAGIVPSCPYYALDSVSSFPVAHFAGHESWGREVFVIPEYSFAVDCTGQELSLSREHSQVRWASYADVSALLKWDSNKIALWELAQRIESNLLNRVPPP